MRCGLLGRTLGHSYSPAIHAALSGGDYSYELFEVEPENLASFLEQGDFHGLNVTIPYKTAVIPFCKQLSPDATAIGSVNTIIRFPDGSLYGNNTDAVGFLVMLQKSGIMVKRRKVLVLGSGGSSRTVCRILKEQKAGEIVLVSRNGPVCYEDLDRHADADVIVNTTPVGMYPNTEASPVELSRFPRLKGVLDLIYNPTRTRLLQEAERRNIPHLGGLPMLVGQAAEAMALFISRIADGPEQHTVLQMLRRQMENLILIGMPGSGKSTIGRLVAKSMGRPFLDADQAIEEAADCTIPEIFQQEGEGGFRRRETEVLAALGKRSGLVIATGGGCVTRPENYPHLHQNGTIVHLERALTALPREGRPLSLTGDLEAMYKIRLPLYQSFADRTVENAGDPETVAAQVLEVFYETLSH